MTQRKPPQLSFETWIDQQIRDAERRGLFEDLPGHGRPLADLEEAADPAWWAKKLLRREGVSLLPPALELRARLERLRDALPSIASEAQLRERLAALDREIRALNRTAPPGPASSVPPIDEEAWLARWREARAAASRLED